MILLQVNDLTKYFGADLILSNIKLEVQSNDRVALVGKNGAGKSTLLKVIAGQYSHDGGEIIKPKDLTIGYLAQNSGLESNLSIWDEMMTVFEPLKLLERRLRELESQMADPQLLNSTTKYEKVLEEYDTLQVQFKDKGGYQYEADIRSVLHGLNFSDYDHRTQISTLSGGQKTRLGLAKLLLTKPELLILDEPTNHLDIETLSWLEQYLQSYPGALLIVSHDRYFLDRVVNQVYEISRMKSTKYHGNYSKYLEEKANRLEREWKQFEKQQEEIARTEEFIQKNIARASTTKRAQSRRKQLQRIERLDVPQGAEKAASFSFDIERISGNDVLKVRDLSIGYPNSTALSEKLTFSINRGDSISLVGPNGVGKSTLIKTINNLLKPITGEIQYGSHVKIGYYDQEQANLTSNKRVLDELWDEYPNYAEKEIRNVLGNFLFSGDDVLKNVQSLSGGEKARLALAKLMMQNANFLILDEPTNHLDLDSKQVLENALIDYPGTLLFVSHDRFFINRIATQVFELSNEGITEYLGDYDYYQTKKQETLELAQLEELEKQGTKDQLSTTSPQPNKEKFALDKEEKRKKRQQERRIKELEEQISEVEATLAEIAEQLCDPNVYEDYEKSQQLNEKNEHQEQLLLTLMEEWESLQEG
ncbi:ABC-F family ATP-binding cassette domain-containing protein [Bacillus solimangrovi]|uniref:Multidrug ABC transporter ATP-binding protein n=1 Tax=Bacillus solimangrovi TaxID=1305675 RepID=A0A1E5LCB6_9BACI|nr:ABC-F family ATP-binding cassette domain-containing protein [Bacillus solimangrovi]OEH91726.1 multidrug ABC transporter ATP-binding protein [Bacillus solimangrovi]